jgi:hypothetical protein
MEKCTVSLTDEAVQELQNPLGKGKHAAQKKSSTH